MSPARQLDPGTGDPMRDLARSVLAMTPERLKVFTAQLEPADLEVLERAVEQWTGQGWRSSPAAMANHLTGGELKLWRYAVLLSDKYVEAIRGTDTRQLWNLPSQMGKTAMTCTYGVPWALQENPRLRIMYITFDADKAVEEGGKARDFIEEHPELGVELRRDRRARGMWRTPQGGGLYAVGIYGGIIGYPADVILLDDIIKGWQVAHSETHRNAVWNIYRSQVRLRSQGAKTAILHVSTRWHEDDPSGRMLNPPDDEFAERWTHIRLPAIAEEHDPNSDDPLLRTPDPLGRRPGEVIEPERFDEQEVRARAAVLQSYLAAGLEQQRPAAEAGNELLREWFRLEETLPTRPDASCSSWDLKLKDREAGDYVVGQAWWRVAGGYWCMDQIRGQYDHATTANAIALLAVRHPEIRTHVIEAAGSADEVIPQLRDAKPDYTVTDEMASRLGMNAEERRAVQAMRRRGMSGLLPKQPTGDKRIRARAYTAPVAEAGDVHLPAHAPWVPAYLDEHAAFPRGSHDDQVDATSQALARLTRSPATLRSGKGTIPVNTAGSNRGLPRGVVRMPRR